MTWTKKKKLPEGGQQNFFRRSFLRARTERRCGDVRRAPYLRGCVHRRCCVWNRAIYFSTADRWKRVMTSLPPGHSRSPCPSGLSFAGCRGRTGLSVLTVEIYCRRAAMLRAPCPGRTRRVCTVEGGRMRYARCRRPPTCLAEKQSNLRLSRVRRSAKWERPARRWPPGWNFVNRSYIYRRLAHNRHTAER